MYNRKNIAAIKNTTITEITKWTIFMPHSINEVRNIPAEQTVVCSVEEMRVMLSKRNVAYIQIPMLIAEGTDKGCGIFCYITNRSDLRRFGLPNTDEDLHKAKGMRFKVKITHVEHHQGTLCEAIILEKYPT